VRLDARTFANYGLSKVAPGLITLAAIPLTVRAIGAAGYGVYSSTWALTVLTTSLFGGWVRTAALRATGDADHALGRLPRSVLVATSIAPAVPAIGWALIIMDRNPELGSVTLVLTAAVFAAANGLYTLITTRTQRDGKSGTFAVAETVRAGLGLGITLVLAFGHLVEGAAAVFIGYVLGTLIASVVAVWSNPPSLRPPGAQAGLVAAYWRYGWPMSLWLGSSTALVYADRFVLTHLLGPTVAGRYAAVADLLVRGTAVVTSPIIMAIHPAVMAHWNNGRIAEALSTLRRTAQVMAALLGLAVLGAVFIGPFVLRFVVPQDTASRVVLGGLAFGSAMWQLGIVAHKPFELVAKNLQMLVIALAAMCVTVVLDLVLVPVLGTAGAVVALCSGATGYTIVCAVTGTRLLRQHLAVDNPSVAIAGVR
jgi:O-antigen/teichoic acid export membrane protein